MDRPVEPWCIRETALDPDRLPAAASVFAVANGHVGVRGVLEEDTTRGWSTLHGQVYEETPHTYVEGGYGYPESDEHVVTVVDGWNLGWTVDDVPLTSGAGTVLEHERCLDLRRGVLHRELFWASPTGARVALTTRRMVPLTRQEVVATWWELRAVDPVTVTVRPVPGCGHRDPVDGSGHYPVTTLGCRHEPGRSWVHQHAASTDLDLTMVTEHQVRTSPGARATWTTSAQDATVQARLEPGQWLQVVVLAAHAAGTGPVTALRSRAERALTDAVAAGWDRLQEEQCDYLSAVWDRADVVVEGDDQLQQALRFAVFQAVQASAQVQEAGVRAKGLTGTGYHGHAFWDAECFVLPVLDHVLPGAAAAQLRWRQSRLPQALERARELGLSGATFPWRTISGKECSGYWPAGTAAFHINADVALAASRHLLVTGDEAFGRHVAVELVVQTARLWHGRGHHADDGFRIDGVTGPDEYSALDDNNAYTNLMARKNLRAAVELTARFTAEAARLGVTEDERAAWGRAADRMVVPYRSDLGVTEQSEGFTRQAPWTFHRAEAQEYPLADHAPFVELYPRQVVKQADVVLALHLAGEEFSLEQKRRDLEYYEPITVRDSSLSAPAQGVIAAEVGYLDLAYAYLRETALIDLHDLRGSTRDGLHIAAMAGAWTILVAGFGGLRDLPGAVRLAPVLPPGLRRLSFQVRRGEARLGVDVTRTTVTYRLVAGTSVRFSHHGRELELTADRPVQQEPVPAREVPATPAPSQPPGRAPLA